MSSAGTEPEEGQGIKWHIYIVHYWAPEVRDVGAVVATGGSRYRVDTTLSLDSKHFCYVKDKS